MTHINTATKTEDQKRADLVHTWGYLVDDTPESVGRMADVSLHLSTLRLPDALVALGFYDDVSAVHEILKKRTEHVPMLAFIGGHDARIRERHNEILTLMDLLPFYSTADDLFGKNDTREFSIVDDGVILTMSATGLPRLVFLTHAQMWAWQLKQFKPTIGESFVYVGKRPILAVGNVEAIIADRTCLQLSTPNEVTELKIVEADLRNGMYVGSVVCRSRDGLLLKYCRNRAAFIPEHVARDSYAAGDSLAVLCRGGNVVLRRLPAAVV